MSKYQKVLDLGDWTPKQGQAPKTLFHGILAGMRRHFGMEAAFISQFVDGRRRFEYVDTDQPELGIKVGASDPLEESYCQAIVDGRLPELIHDAQTLPAAQAFPATKAIPIGAHLSVPLRLSNGRVYGTFCCFSREANHSLNSRDVNVIHSLADMVSEVVEADVESEQRSRDIRLRIETVRRENLLSMVFQPIFDIERGQIYGFEALARFASEPYRGPDVWFHEAREVGLDGSLEFHAIELALGNLHHLPPQAHLTLNVSPKAILENDIRALLETQPLDRLILEVSEHDQIEDYESFNALLRPLRYAGLQLAVDDAGSGYSSLRHILRVKPDIVKLDMSITKDIDVDPLCRSLASGLVAFTHANGIKLIAEGVDRSEELDALRGVGADLSQGYWHAHPMTVDQMRAAHLWS
jgi:EAL domain-containing protein (putative c-di-GMP-specific phosphodiesterase class I)